MASITHKPQLRNAAAGRHYYDPMHASIFEVTFSVPSAISAEFGNDEYLQLLGEQVTTVSGLDALQKTTSAGEQKFLGASASYLNPVLDNTYADLTIEFNLNIRSANDVYVLRFFKEWEKCSYNLQTGERKLMANYIMPKLTVKEANRDGTVWRVVEFEKVMLTGVTGLDGLDYTSNEARKLSCTFRADLWTETIEEGIAGS